VYDNDLERNKRTTRHIGELPVFRSVLSSLCSGLSEWTSRLGYRVEEDPLLHGGGLHVTGPGGYLHTHLDYDRHPLHPGLRRALNMIAFLHPEWRDGWGGELYLADPLGNPVRLFRPEPGRVVAFECSDLSYHGVLPTAANATERVSLTISLLSVAGPQNTRLRALFLPKRAKPTPSASE
jgi:Rps23 Pro-64 3,4-dihydroxylase Tpa1-like proline 4-hydroxylase